MPSTVNVGSLEATLGIKNAYAADFAKFKSEANAIADRLKKLEDSFSKTNKETEKSKETAKKIEAEYRKVAASLDPVVANTHKYEKAEAALNNALKIGIITQDHHNKSLIQAKEKFLGVGAQTLTWHEEMQRLTNVISPFATRMADISVLVKDLNGALGGTVKAGTSTGDAFSSLLGILKPYAAVLLGVAAAAGAAYLSIKILGTGFQFLSEAVQTGLKTQLIVEKLNYALAANGSASGLSAAKMVEYAESLELVTARSKEEILAAETILSRFDSLGNEAFPKALDVTLAYAKAMGITADSAANKLGPAFDGSTRSLNALKDAGVVFTAGQRKTLTEMVEAGKIIEYQALLFDILKEKVGEAGNGYDNNLTRQVGRAKIVLEDFGEGIATEVIPALEDLVSELVEAAGGWDYLKFIVASAGREIGDIIRKTIYGIMIGYHEWQSGTDQLAAIVLGGLSRIAEGFADFAPLAAFVPGMQGLAAVSEQARGASERLGNAALKAGMSAAKHEVSIVSLSQKLVQHRTALEGDEEAHIKLGSSIDEVTSATKKQKSAMDEVTNSIEEMQRKVINLRSAYLAALISTKAYNAEILRQKVIDAILKEENKLREVGAKLTQDQRDAIASAVIEEEELNKKIKTTIDLNQRLLSVVLRATENISGKGFAADFKRFTDDAHRGMELIAIDVEEMLNGLKKIKDLDLEVEFSSRLNNVEPHLRGLEADYLSFLENLGSGFEQAGENAIDAGERILLGLPEALGRTIEEIRAHLQSLRDAPAIEALELSGSSSLQKYRDQQKEINRIVAAGTAKGVDVTEGGQKALIDLQQEFWRENLSNWSSALGFLADEFGGFFSYLSQAVNVLQQAQGMQSSMSNIGSAMGMSSAGMGAMGAFGAYLVIAKAMYDEFKRHAESRQARRYDYGAVFSKDAGADWNTPVEGQALAVSHQIQKTAEAFAESIGATIRIFADLEVHVRQDGKYFRAMVEGELIGQFESMAEATSAALLAAFASVATDLRGVSELVKSGFAYITSDLGKLKINNLEDAGEFLTKLREISELSWSDGAVATLEQVRHFDSLWATLGKLQEATPPVIQGFTDLIAAEINSWRAWSDSITGRQKTQEELLAEKKADAALFEAQKAFRIAELELKKLDLQAQAAFLQGKGKGLEIEGKIKEGELKLGKEFLIGKATLYSAELTLNEQFLLALTAQIEAINILIKSLLDLPKIDIDKIKIPKGKGGGGQSDSVKDWISDRRFDLNTRGMGEYAKSVLDKEREYQSQLEQLGKKDKTLRSELIALKERELQLMAQERMEAVSRQYGEFLGLSNSFTQVRDTLAELIADIEDSPFGSADRIEMISNAIEEANRQIEELSLQSASSLFGSLISDLEKFGASESMLTDARMQFAIIEHTLKVANYQAEFEILKANGSLSEAILNQLGAAIDFVAGIDPTKFITPVEPVQASSNRFRNEVNSTVDDLKRLKEAFQSAKDKILDTVLAFDRGEFGAVVPEAGWLEAKRQFDQIISSAKAGNLEAFQEAPEAFKNTLDVLKEFSPALFATLAPELRNQLKGLADLTTVKEGNLVITDFEKRAQHRETVDTLHAGFADLSSHASNQTATLESLYLELRRNGESQRELNARLTRLESSALGTHR